MAVSGDHKRAESELLSVLERGATFALAPLFIYYGYQNQWERCLSLFSAHAADCLQECQAKLNIASTGWYISFIAKAVEILASAGLADRSTLIANLNLQKLQKRLREPFEAYLQSKSWFLSSICLQYDENQSDPRAATTSVDRLIEKKELFRAFARQDYAAVIAIFEQNADLKYDLECSSVAIISHSIQNQIQESQDLISNAAFNGGVPILGEIAPLQFLIEPEIRKLITSKNFETIFSTLRHWGIHSKERRDFWERLNCKTPLRKRIMAFTPDKLDDSFQSKFGGQPDWLEPATWPISPTTKTPLSFMAQVRLSDALIDSEGFSMAYLFVSQDGEATWDPDLGENCVIVQKRSDKPSSYSANLANEGPSWGPAFTITGEICQETFSDVTMGEEFDYRSKLGGFANWIQPPPDNYSEWHLVMQISDHAAPFQVIFGGGEGYLLISPDKKTGKFLWFC